MNRARHGATLLLAAGLALALAGGLAACSGSAGGDPSPALAETAPQAAVPAEPPEPDASMPTARVTPAPQAETPEPPTPTADAPIPEPPAEPVAPVAPEASLPSDEPASTAPAASEPPPAPGEPPTGDPSTATDEAEVRSLLYDTYDRSGAVAEPGHYAFLADGADLASVVTTYEGLRDGTATALLIHTHDAHGVSQAARYDTVATGDLVEWKQADDCFVRYTVTSAPAPAAVTRAFGVAWMTYAFTGCSGPIAAAPPRTLRFGDLPVLGGTSLTAPVVHGVTQLIPEDWTGALVEPDLRGDPSGPPEYVYTTDITTARTLPYWREPRLPDDWTLEWAEGGPGSLYASVFGYIASYRDDRNGGVEIYGFYVRDALVRPVEAVMGATSSIAAETRVVNGRPVVVVYSPPGPNHSRTAGAAATIYDPATETAYTIYGAGGVGGTSLDTILAILGSLFESPNPP